MVKSVSRNSTPALAGQILLTFWLQLRDTEKEKQKIRNKHKNIYLDVSMTTDSLFTPNIGEEVTLTDNADDTNVKTSSFINCGPDSGPFTLIEGEPESDRTFDII